MCDNCGYHTRIEVVTEPKLDTVQAVVLDGSPGRHSFKGLAQGGGG
jgi:hypothetical protein